MDTNITHTKHCQSCGEMQYYVKLKGLKAAIKNNTLCRCCNLKKGKAHKGFYREIPYTWFNEKKRKSTSKEREWSITIEYIWDVYLRQDRKCALSGLPLDFDKDTDNGMVSIDRIDNNKGYVKRNVQLLHKDVNFAKWTFGQKYFINLCKQVSEYKK